MFVPRAAAALRRVPTSVLLGMAPVIAAALRLNPGLRVRVIRNMTAALGPAYPRPGQVDAFLRNIADQLVHSAALFRSAGETTAAFERRKRGDLTFRARFDEGAAAVRGHLEHGRGVVIVVPHLAGQEPVVAMGAAEVPVTFLIRRSQDAAYEAVKQQWFASLGVEIVYRPSRHAPQAALEEAMAAIRTLRKNRVLVLAPDLLQKPGEGVPVRLFGREAELPVGPFYLAARTDAPLVPIFDYSSREEFRGAVLEPLRPSPGKSGEEAIADLAQQWATLFEAYLREQPERWQFWLDKRWTRWLAG